MALNKTIDELIRTANERALGQAAAGEGQDDREFITDFCDRMTSLSAEFDRLAASFSPLLGGNTEEARRNLIENSPAIMPMGLLMRLVAVARVMRFPEDAK